MVILEQPPTNKEQQKLDLWRVLTNERIGCPLLTQSRHRGGDKE